VIAEALDKDASRSRAEQAVDKVIRRWMRRVLPQETLGVSCGRLRGKRPGMAFSTDS